MRAYAVAYVDGEEEDKMKARTSVDERGGENPVWNDVLTLSVREAQLRKDSLACLTVDIYSRGGRLALFRRGDRLVGSVRIFLSDVVKQAEEGASPTTFYNPIQCLAFWVRLPSGEPHGILNVWIPPSGQFLRRHHDSQDFSRVMAFPPPSSTCGQHPTGRSPPLADLHIRCRVLSPADRASSLPSAPLRPQDFPCDTEIFTFDV